MSHSFAVPLIHTLAASLMLTMGGATSAAAIAKRVPARVAHVVAAKEQSVRSHRRNPDSHGWMTLVVGVITVGYSMGRRQRPLESLPPAHEVLA